MHGDRHGFTSDSGCIHCQWGVGGWRWNRGCGVWNFECLSHADRTGGGQVVGDDNALHRDAKIECDLGAGVIADGNNVIERRLRRGGGNVRCGQGEGYESGCYVRPCIAEAPGNLPIVCDETFAPLLYMMKYKTLDEAIELHNGVPQGLSSAIFSRNMLETEKFLSHEGSDCGIANVNIGTSGTDIGGAVTGLLSRGGE